MVDKSQTSRLDINSLTKAIKWFFCDRVVVFSIVAGVIFLLLTLTIYSKNVKSIRFKGIDYSSCKTAPSRLLFKMATPGLAVRYRMKQIPLETIPQHLYLYSLMFAVQIIAYAVVGKVARIMSSDVVVAVCVCIGIIFLVLALAYDIRPAHSSVVDMVRGKPFELLLVMSNLAVSFVCQHLSFAYGGTAIMSFFYYPIMFIIQIVIYGLLGRLISNMLPRSEGGV